MKGNRTLKCAVAFHGTREHDLSYTDITQPCPQFYAQTCARFSVFHVPGSLSSAEIGLQLCTRSFEPIFMMKSSSEWGPSQCSGATLRSRKWHPQYSDGSSIVVALLSASVIIQILGVLPRCWRWPKVPDVALERRPHRGHVPIRCPVARERITRIFHLDRGDRSCPEIE